MKTLRLILALVVLIVLNSVQQGIAFEFDKGTLTISKLTLENGLTVILNEDKSTPEVYGMIAVRAGGKNDPADATGLAHYMEHMLFKGTQNLGTISWEKEKPHIDRIIELYDELAKAASDEDRKNIQQKINEESLKAAEYAIPNELSNLVRSMGGTNLNAGTGPDYTLYYNKFPASEIYKWIDLYAHRFIDPVFRSFQAELEVVYEEKNMYSDQFQSRLFDEFQSLLFKNHPYGQQPLIGTIEHLKNPSLKRMLEFYNNYYVANNMALIITGNFSTNEILPHIEEKFGAIHSRQLPDTPIWEEKPFNGREFHKARLTPVKIGLLGFRTTTKDNPDYVALEVAMQILNNGNQTGLLDRLTIDGKLLAAQAFNMPYNDHGAVTLLLVPKIVGQRISSAESIVLEELAKLSTGDFDDWMLDAVKLNMYSRFQKSLENLENRAWLFAEAFTSERSIEEALDYPNRIMAVSKDDIMRVAQQYFGNDFLAFHSRMGFPKKEKIEKPGFKPLASNTNAKSEYAIHFDTIPSKELIFKTIDFENDIAKRDIANGVELFHVYNPVNDIFTLTLKYLVGNYHINLLDKATEMMYFSGTEKQTVDELKMEFAKIGCTYSIYSNDSFTYVKLEGLEENLPRALELINELITSPKLEQDKLKTMVNGEKATRKIERSEPDNVASALFDFMRYGEESKSINRPTMRNLKRIKADELTKAFTEATQHLAMVHYAGKANPDSIKNLVSGNLTFASQPRTVETPVVLQAQEFEENTIYFVNKKKARQSKIFFFVNGNPHNLKAEPYLEAFNEYFGGGFSGLVLQEIREYRSLAYGAGGTFRLPPIEAKPIDFIGYVATQSDKSITAIETYDSLIRIMPQKPERIELIKDYLMLSAQTRRPSFRNLSTTVEHWQRLGYTSDPILHKKPVYQSLNWDDLMIFYQNNLANKPVAIAIVGDKRMIDLDALKRFGKVIEIKEKDLFSK